MNSVYRAGEKARVCCFAAVKVTASSEDAPDPVIFVYGTDLQPMPRGHGRGNEGATGARPAAVRLWSEQSCPQALQTASATAEVDHRGIVLPRRHALGGIITPQ